MELALDFHSLDNLRKYLAGLQRTHVSTLEYYLSYDNNGFFHQPSSKQNASRASTATCVSSLVGAGLWDTKFKLWDHTSKVVDKLLSKPRRSADLPEDNAFTLSFIAESVLDLGLAHPSYPGRENHEKVILEDIAPKLVEALMPTGGIKMKPYPESAYLTQLTHRALKRIDVQLKPENKLVSGALQQRVASWSRKEIDRQIALISARSKIADPLSLAYAIALSMSAQADDQTSPEDKQIFAYALELFFASQREDGTWPSSRPLFHYPDVGNAYCYEYEVLTQLLLTPSLMNEMLQYIPQLSKAALYLEQSAYDLDPAHSGRQLAWASGHHPQIAGPESWSTASVYHFAHGLDRLVAEGIRRAVFTELGTIYKSPLPSKNPATQHAEFAKDFLDADLTLDDKSVLSLRKTLADSFVFPIARSADQVAHGRSLPERTPMSAILFGPPGTSKTQLAKLIGEFLGWPLLSVDPSYLVSEGMDRIQAQANKLFSMLAASEQIIVLLDEFDEMGRDRSRNTATLLSRFITTAMLPKLAQINTERKIVFLLATNYISGFDAAFSRGGRFDMLLQIMPPNAKSKLAKWPVLQSAIDKLGKDEQADAIVAISNLTYLECVQLASKLSEIPEPTRILEAIKQAVATGTMLKLNDSGETPQGDTGEEADKNEDDIKAHRTTWMDTSTAERKAIRIPQ